MKKLFAVILIIFAAGCAAAERAAYEVGKPVAATMKTMSNVSEGAREVYAGEQISDNPFNR